MLNGFFLFWIFLTVLYYVVSDDDADLFSKFYQSDYSVKDDRLTLLSYNKQLFHEMSMISFKYNRTTNCVNFTMYPTVDLTEQNMMALLQVYKRYGNEYKIFPIRIWFNFCKTLKNNLMGIGTFTCGSLSCPMLKDVRQHGCNWTPDYSRLPPLMPDGQYSLNAQVTYNGQDLFSLKYLCTVYRKVKIN